MLGILKKHNDGSVIGIFTLIITGFFLFTMLGQVLYAEEDTSKLTDDQRVNAAADLYKDNIEFAILNGVKKHKLTEKEVTDQSSKFINGLNNLYPDPSKIPAHKLNVLVQQKLLADKREFRKYFKSQESEDRLFETEIRVMKLDEGPAQESTPNKSKSAHNKSASKPADISKDQSTEDENAEAPVSPTPIPTPKPAPDEVQKALNSTVGDVGKSLGF